MRNYAAKQKERLEGNRPSSERLKELHVYKVPRERWLERRKLAKNQVVDQGISLGFLRVVPEITLIDLRNEIGLQLQDDLLPDNYIFLKSVGRNFTQIKPNQELELKAKYFSPPIADQPEIYILEGSYISRMNSSAETSDIEEWVRQQKNAGKKKKSKSTTGGSELNKLTEMTVQQLKAELRQLGLSITGSRRDILSRLLDAKLHQMTVYQLKTELRRHGLPVTGLKDDLVSRLHKVIFSDMNLDEESNEKSKSTGGNSELSKLFELTVQQLKVELQLLGLPASGSKKDLVSKLLEAKLQQMTVHQLKTESRRYGLPITGDKDEIVSRLYEALFSKMNQDGDSSEHKSNVDTSKQRKNKKFDKEALDGDITVAADVEEDSPHDNNKADSWVDTSSNTGDKAAQVTNKSKQTKMVSKTRTKVSHVRGVRTRRNHSLLSKSKGGSRRNGSKAATIKSPNKLTNGDDITVEEKIEMLTTKESTGDEVASQILEHERVIEGEIQDDDVTQQILKHERVIEDESEEEENLSQLGSGKLKIDVNAELINGKAEGTQVIIEIKTDTKERDELLEKLNQTRDEKRQVEKERERLVQIFKALQNKENNRKKQAQQEWKKRYIEAKKLTPILEEQCSKLKLELEKLHRNLLNDYENRKRKKLVANGKPCQKTTYKITISKLYGEIDDLMRKIETAKVRLSAETKLRMQAEKEVKILRRDLVEKKIHVTLTRAQKFNLMPSARNIRLSAY